MAASALRLSARGPRPANTGGMGTVGIGTATAEGSGLCAKGAVAQTDYTCKSLRDLSSAVPELWFSSSGGVCVCVRVCREPLYL